MAEADGKEPSSNEYQVRCSYHKDHGHKTKHCKTLKKFLKSLVIKGHLAEYIKGAEEAKRKDNDDDREEEEEEKPGMGPIEM